MTREQIWDLARRQSAWDLGCEPGDFQKDAPVVVLSKADPRARKYLTLPFYCAAWCNLPSVRNAIRSGFRPAWVEMSARPAAEVDGMNAR